MNIRKIKIENFKSFKSLEVDLKDLNVLIGANASGKSNFIHIFEFLRDIVNFGLENAISMQGGPEYFRNINIGPTGNFSIEIHCDAPGEQTARFSLNNYNWTQLTYRFSLEFFKTKKGFKVIEDQLTMNSELFDLAHNKKEIGNRTIIFNNNSGNIEKNVVSPATPNPNMDIFPLFNPSTKLPPNTLLLEDPILRAQFKVAELFQSVSVYNFDPKLPKKGIPITGKTELEEDGGNLAIALKNVIEDKQNRKQFSSIIKDVLNFVDNLDIEKSLDRTLLVKLREVYSKNKFLPASFLSDGTINIIALILALYFGKKTLMIIEEPERNIHPKLISKVLEMMKEVSARKQVIVTTHNPEFLKHALPDDILFMSRDKDGFSQISRPSENAQVNVFLENEMGIDELYVQNLLEP